jgi:hypothetical protein
MTPEQKLKIRQMYADNLIELMSLLPEPFAVERIVEDISEAAETHETKEQEPNPGWP